MKKPKISVIVATYNREKLLQRAIDSVLAQTFKDFELIVVDDHSDKPPNIKLPNGEDRLVAMRLPHNTGYCVKPRNVGIMVARGDYICFLGKTLIETSNGMKQIRDIKSGELVKTHRGRFKKVLQTNKREYNQRNPLIQINTEFNTIKCTPEHPFLVVRNTISNWVKANDIEKNDWLFYPSIHKKNELVFNVFGNNQNNSLKNSDYYGEYEVDTDLARFLGLYLAEGCGGHDSIRFTFNNKEKELIEFIKRVCLEKFNRKPTIYKRWATTVKLNIRSFSDLFISWFGKYATSKRIPDFVFEWNLKNQLAFINGYVEGDGCDDKGGITVVTASKQLTDDFIKLCDITGLKTGKPIYQNPSKSKIRGRIFENKGNYHIRMYKNSWNRLNDLLNSSPYNVKINQNSNLEGYIINVKSIVHKKMSQDSRGKNQYVYNLEIEGDNSYVANSFAVHNCYLDDDNVYLPNHLKVLYEAIVKHQADVVYGDRVYKSNNPNETKFMGKQGYPYDLKRIEQGNYVDTSDIMHTIQSINDVGFWDIFWERKGDWLLMVRFGKAGMRIIHVPEVITEYWWGDSNIGQQNPLGGEFPQSTRPFREHIRNLAKAVNKK